MDVRIKVAIIGAVCAIIAAIITGLFNLYQSSQSPSNSPIINIDGDLKGDIKINYNYGGIPIAQSIIDEWKRQLKKQNIKDEILENKIQELVKEWNDFLTDLSKRSPERTLSQRTVKNISSGNFNEAEEELKSTFDFYQSENNFSAAAAIANDIRMIKELQLKTDFSELYEKASEQQKKLNFEDISPPDYKEESSKSATKPDSNFKKKPPKQKSTNTQREYTDKKEPDRSYPNRFRDYKMSYYLLDEFTNNFCGYLPLKLRSMFYNRYFFERYCRDKEVREYYLRKFFGKKYFGDRFLIKRVYDAYRLKNYILAFDLAEDCIKQNCFEGVILEKHFLRTSSFPISRLLEKYGFRWYKNLQILPPSPCEPEALYPLNNLVQALIIKGLSAEKLSRLNAEKCKIYGDIAEKMFNIARIFKYALYENPDKLGYYTPSFNYASDHLKLLKNNIESSHNSEQRN